MREGQAPLSFLNLLLAAFCAGIAAVWQIFGGDSAPSYFIYGAAAAGVFLLAAAFWCRRKSSAGTVILCALLFFVLGIGRFMPASALPASDISNTAGGSAEITGQVVHEPRIQPSPDGKGWRFRYLVEARNVKASSGERRATGRLYVSGTVKEKEKLPVAREGDIVRAYGKLRHIHGYRNPGQLDLGRQARSQGITARLSADKGRVQILPQEGHSFSRTLTDIRNYYRQVLGEAMPENDAAAIFAMLFGGYDGIRAEMLEAFTSTGIVHILSVSGSHITLLAAVVAWIGYVLHLRRGVTAALITAAIVVYVMLSEAVAPAVRSGIMGMLAALAVVAERERDARQILTVTGLLMLLWSPWLLFDISFELSFAATAGLLYIAPKLRELPWMQRLPRWLSGSLAITLSAQLSVLPILARYFHVVSLSSLFANFLVVPVLEIIMMAALFAGMAAVCIPFTARVVLAGDSLLLGGVYELTKLLAHLPLSQVYLPPVGAGVTGLYYVLLIFFLQPRERRALVYDAMRSHTRIAAVTVGCAAVLLAGPIIFHKSEMAVHFIDVGQGDAALVVTPHGRAFMIDTGGTRDAAFDVGGRVDVPYLLQQGVQKLDFIFLTHAHEDHAMGAGGIIRKLPVGTVVTADEGMLAYRAAMGLSAQAAAKQPFIAPPKGTEILIDGVRVEVLYAPKVSDVREKSGNECSNVYRVSYGKASFLFTGDLVKESEAELLREIDPKSTVLKVGHHGSKTSTSEPFLSAVHPQWAVICAGFENSFGHPDEKTLQTLLKNGVKTYRTDRDGAVTFITDGETMRVNVYVKP